MYAVFAQQMELVIKSNCVICESQCQLIHQMDRFAKDNPSMLPSVLFKKLHQMAQKYMEILSGQQLEHVDITLEDIKFHYNSCVFFKQSQYHKDLRLLNDLQEELMQNKTTKNMNLLLKTIDQRTKLLEKLSDKDESILDSIPVFN